MRPVSAASAEQEAPGSHIGEHLEAVISGRLRQAFFLTLLILVVELAGGVLSHSLALLSDAGHVTTDIFALGLAWFAVKQTERPADDVRSYGYHRAGILAAMANGATLIVLVFVIGWEAAQRFAHPEPVQGGIVIVSALVGVAVNSYVAMSFREQGANLNIRAAVLHAVGDLVASIGVIVAGVVIIAFGAYRTHHATAAAPDTGACVQARNTDTSNASVEKVDCSDSNAQYVVLAKVLNGHRDSCLTVTGTEAVFTVSDKGGKVLYVLCLKGK